MSKELKKQTIAIIFFYIFSLQFLHIFLSHPILWEEFDSFWKHLDAEIVTDKK